MHGVPPIIGSLLEELHALPPEDGLQDLGDMIPLQEVSRLFDCMTLSVAHDIRTGDSSMESLLKGKARLENLGDLQRMCTDLMLAKAQREQEIRDGIPPEHY